MKPLFQKHKRFFISTFFGAVFVCASGTLLHFSYQWSHYNFIMGLISPVNESVWEHMKMIFFPALFFYALEYVFLFRIYGQLLRADLAGMLAGTISIPILFYIYTGLIGQHLLFMDILIFIFSSVFTFYARYRSIMSPRPKKYTFIYFLCILSLALCFLIFTYYPPDMALFISP
jgi:hypothetical protein